MEFSLGHTDSCPENGRSYRHLPWYSAEWHSKRRLLVRSSVAVSRLSGTSSFIDHISAGTSSCLCVPCVAFQDAGNLGTLDDFSALQVSVAKGRGRTKVKEQPPQPGPGPRTCVVIVQKKNSRSARVMAASTQTFSERNSNNKKQMGRQASRQRTSARRRGAS